MRTLADATCARPLAASVEIAVDWGSAVAHLLRPRNSRLGALIMPRVLEAGDIPPRYRFPAADGDAIDLLDDSIAGKTLALLLVRQIDARAVEWLASAEKLATEFARCGCRFFAVLPNIPETNIPETGLEVRSYPILVDPESRIFADFGVDAGAGHRAVVIRSNYHVFNIGPPGNADPVAWMLAAARQLAQARRTLLMEAHPPVLLIPDVLSKGDCDRLINVFNTRGKRFVDPGPGLDRFGTDY